MIYKLKLRILALVLFIRHSKSDMTFQEAEAYKAKCKGMARGYLNGK